MGRSEQASCRRQKQKSSFILASFLARSSSFFFFISFFIALKIPAKTPLFSGLLLRSSEKRRSSGLLE